MSNYTKEYTNSYFFEDTKQKSDYIEKEAEELIKSNSISVPSKVYIGVKFDEIDLKSKIIDVLNTTGILYDIETFENCGFYSINASFPEILHGDKFYNFICSNFPNVSVELDILENDENLVKYKCPVCSRMYNSLNDAVSCCWVDCEEQAREHYIEEKIYFNSYK